MLPWFGEVCGQYFLILLVLHNDFICDIASRFNAKTCNTAPYLLLTMYCCNEKDVLECVLFSERLLVPVEIHATRIEPIFVNC